MLGASSYTFAWASLTQTLPDWIEAQVRALKFFGGVTKAIVCDNLKAAVAKPLWFEPSITKTFADMAAHYDTTVLPTRPRKPRDKGKVEGAVLIVERWILARLRNTQFFSVEALNAAIAELLADLNARPMRRIGRSRRDLFEEIERSALRELPSEPFEYAEWKRAKIHPDYHIDVLHNFYSLPHRLIGKHVDVRLTHRMVEIFHNHERVAAHTHRGTRGGHSTVKEHMPSYTTPRDAIFAQPLGMPQSQQVPYSAHRQSLGWHGGSWLFISLHLRRLIAGQTCPRSRGMTAIAWNTHWRLFL